MLTVITHNASIGSTSMRSRHAAHLRVWHDRIEGRSTFLRRLPRLRRLHLRNCPDDDALAGLLMLYSHSTAGRITELLLEVESIATIGMCGVALAFPNLDRLELKCKQMHGDLLLPLRSLPLSQVQPYMCDR